MMTGLLKAENLIVIVEVTVILAGVGALGGNGASGGTKERSLTIRC